MNILLWVGSPILAYLLFRIYEAVCIYYEYKRLKAAGVAFNDKEGFSLFRDALSIRQAGINNPYEFVFVTA